MTEQIVTVEANDGYTLAASLFTPLEANQRIILINGALGVKRSYYGKFATYLAAQGFTVLTYDYRGIGDSKQGSLRGFKASLLDWAARDQTAMIDWVCEQHPDYKLLIVGHSLGGQIVGLTANNHHILGVLTVASQSGYWLGWRKPLWRALMFILWFIQIPLLSRLFGYFPGSRTGLGEDIPAQVALDWARGGRSRRYLLDLYGGTPNDHYAGFRAPFRSIAIEDDDYAPPNTVETLLMFYPNARTEYQLLRPSEVGVSKIGHFGFFRPTFEATLWAQSAAWLSSI
jgi:predicted alpha/beta hydrolase